MGNGEVNPVRGFGGEGEGGSSIVSGDLEGEGEGGKRSGRVTKPHKTSYSDVFMHVTQALNLNIGMMLIWFIQSSSQLNLVNEPEIKYPFCRWIFLLN